MSYAGEVSSSECWKLLQEDKAAQLIDVRTVAEWNFVGLPDLEAIGKAPIAVEWQAYPGMAVNPGFIEDVVRGLDAAGGDPQSPVYLLCRSGARSLAAAKALTAAGFKQAFNVTDGFEGALDENRHRGTVDGWKHSGLPWKQG